MKFTSILALASLSAVSASVNNDSYIVASTKALENLSCPISLEECDLKTCIRIRTDNNLTHGFNTEDLLQWCKEKKVIQQIEDVFMVLKSVEWNFMKNIKKKQENPMKCLFNSLAMTSWVKLSIFSPPSFREK